MSESILTLSQMLSIYIPEKLQSGVSSSLKIINVSKSLKSIYMYGCILSLKILSKLYKHKGLEFFEGKSSFSRHLLVNPHLHSRTTNYTQIYSGIIYLPPQEI